MTPKEALKAVMRGEYAKADEVIIEALEKADKYRWHDLRKDPTDLPPHGKVVIVFTEGFGFGASIYTHTIGHWNEDKEEWRFDTLAYPILIAWREIEPFASDTNVGYNEVKE